jgi:hypothetical protein
MSNELQSTDAITAINFDHLLNCEAVRKGCIYGDIVIFKKTKLTFKLRGMGVPVF